MDVNAMATPPAGTSRRRCLDAPAPTDIARWLRARDAGATTCASRHFEKLPGGAIQDNWTLDVEIDGGPHGRARTAWSCAPTRRPASPRASSRAQEFAVLRVAHAAGVTAPRPLFLCRDLRGDRARVLHHAAHAWLGRGSSPDARSAAGPRCRRACRIAGRQSGAHPRDSPAASRNSSDLPPPAPITRARRSPNIAPISTACEDAYPALEWGLRWCETHAPAPSAPTLIHRDYRTGNYLVDGGRLSAVLDWEFAGLGRSARGHRLVHRALLALRRARPGSGRHRAAWILSCAATSVSRGAGLNACELDYWQVMAHLRWAIIALQQAQRHAAGGERSLELALTGRIVHELEYELLQLIAGEHAMKNISDAADLIATAREALLNELLPRLPKDQRYAGLMIANAMAIALREQHVGGRCRARRSGAIARSAGRLRRGRRATSPDEASGVAARALCVAIRGGDFDEASRAVRADGASGADGGGLGRDFQPEGAARGRGRA